jgi:hypothetical protein
MYLLFNPKFSVTQIRIGIISSLAYTHLLPVLAFSFNPNAS